MIALHSISRVGYHEDMYSCLTFSYYYHRYQGRRIECVQTFMHVNITVCSIACRHDGSTPQTIAPAETNGPTRITLWQHTEVISVPL